MHLETTPNGLLRKVDVPAYMYPLILAQLLWDAPDIITGAKLSGATKLQVHFLRSKEDVDARLNLIAYLNNARSAHLKDLSLGTQHLLRMVAKIAHGFLVGEIGLGAFDPLLTGIIRGEELSSIGKYIGNGAPTQRDQHAVGHRLYRDQREINGEPYHIVRVGLFPQFGLAEYIVVTGKALV